MSKRVNNILFTKFNRFKEDRVVASGTRADSVKKDNSASGSDWFKTELTIRLHKAWRKNALKVIFVGLGPGHGVQFPTIEHLNQFLEHFSTNCISLKRQIRKNMAEVMRLKSYKWKV